MRANAPETEEIPEVTQVDELETFVGNECGDKKLGEPSSSVFLDTHPRSLIQGSPNFSSLASGKKKQDLAVACCK